VFFNKTSGFGALCFKAFLNNNWFGLAVFSGLVKEFLHSSCHKWELSVWQAYSALEKAES
jgi:hypothetical protein